MCGGSGPVHKVLRCRDSRGGEPSSGQALRKHDPGPLIRSPTGIQPGAEVTDPMCHGWLRYGAATPQPRAQAIRMSK
jgi:hypothetical protein